MLPVVYLQGGGEHYQFRCITSPLSLSLSLSPLILAKLIVKSAMAARTSYYFAYKTPTIDIMRIDER